MNSGWGWAVFSVIFIEIVAIFLLATPQSAQQAREAEYRSAVRILGQERANEARQFATEKFAEHFVQTGLVKNVQATLVPEEEAKARANLQHFMTDTFTWVQQRLDGLWAMIYSAYQRSYIMVFVMMFSIPMIVPALIDGLLERKIAIGSYEVATAVFFHGAKKVLTVMLIMPLFVILLPFSVGAEVWFLWVFALPMAIWMTSKNVQEL